VALATFPRTVFHRMFGELRRPQTKSVVMFASEDQPLHAGLGGCACNLVCIEVCWIENAFALIAVAPFLVGKGVHREMQKAVKLHFMPTKLSFGWHRAVTLGRRSSRKIERTKGRKKPCQILEKAQFHHDLLIMREVPVSALRFITFHP